MLFNSMSRKLEEFQPLDNGGVKMCTCGPSIYQLPHIGNYRTFLFEDILLRYLEYLGYNVRRTLNITDVEDKAISQAKKEDSTLKAITEKNIKIFLEELKKLKVKKPTYIMKSSTSVNQAVQIIKKLLKKGFAYNYRGNVYYDPTKYKGFGKLYGLDMTKWPEKKRRFHKDTYTGNRWNRGDFILWHNFKKGDTIYWKTRLGKGRPAWNIQDPANAMQTLGPKVDVYCGGVDNLIRHHDYIIAVVEGFTGEPFAKFWLHGEHLFVNGKKMSKSRGNIVYPKDLIEHGCQWKHIRFFLINGHYRKRINFTSKGFKKSCHRLQEIKYMVNYLQSLKAPIRKSDSIPKVRKLNEKIKRDFEVNMNNDLHVEYAFDATFTTLQKLVNLTKKGTVGVGDIKKTVANLKKIDQVLKVIF